MMWRTKICVRALCIAQIKKIRWFYLTGPGVQHSIAA